jgi:hypothetical protein
MKVQKCEVNFLFINIDYPIYKYRLVKPFGSCVRNQLFCENNFVNKKNEHGFPRSKRIEKRIKKNTSIFDKTLLSIDVVNFKSVSQTVSSAKIRVPFFIFCT